jgi:uncharacterized membrane protein YoaK (UPF0700 family)
LKAQTLDPQRTRAKSIVALLLTFVAGYVDIVGALTIYNVFTAHMTGITARLGQQLVERNWGAVSIGTAVLSSFFVGAILGRATIETGARFSIRHIGSFTLAIEGLLLAAVIPLGTSALHSGHSHGGSIAFACLLLSMLALAMGLQTATLTRIGPLTIHTTFVTGMLNKLAQLVSHYLFDTYDLHRVPAGSRRTQLLQQRVHTLSQARFIFAIWFMYLTGAVLGTWLGLLHGLQSLYVPCCSLLLAVIIEQVEPLSLEEEKDQPER